MVNSALQIRNKKLFVYLLSFAAAIVLLSFWLINARVAKAATDTCTWSGSGVNSNMSTAGNWTGCDNGNVPEDGDNLVFPSGPINKVVTVNSDMGFSSITFSGSGYTVASAAFESLGVYSSLTISGDNNAFNGYVRLYPSTSATVTHGGSSTSFAHYVVIQPTAANTDIIFDTDTNLTLPMISQTAVNGSSSINTITKTGLGALDLSGAAITGVTASGGIHINEGAFKCETVNCLGNDANELFLGDGADPSGPSLYLNGNDTVPNPITVNTGDGESGSVHVAAEVTLSGAITTSTNLNMFVSGDHTATVISNVILGNATELTLYGVDGYTTNDYVFNGIISGNAGINIDDAHVRFAGSNTYTGVTELFDTGSGSVLSVVDNNSLGNSSAGTIVSPGNTLNFDNAGDVSFEEPLTVGGTGVGGSYPGALVKTNQYVGIDGGVTLTGDTTLDNSTSELLVIGSQISGNYNLSLTADQDDGGFSFAPGGNNTFNDLTVTGAQLLVSGSGYSVIPGNLTLNAVNGELSRITLESDNVIIDDSIITLNNVSSEDALLVSSGVIDTVGTITGDGKVLMGDSDSSISVGGGGVSGEFTGTIQGFTNSQFIIVGGVWTFSGYNTDVGNGFSSYYINGGKFISNAADVSLSLSPFSISSGVLGGTGIIGQVSVYGGAIAPGNSPGCLYPAGDVAFTDENSLLNVEINGTTACSEYDVLNASGNVVLNGAILNVALLEDYTSVYGNVFTIVRGSSVSGAFNGLADDDTLSVNDSVFRVNYTSTKVTLTDITKDESTALSSLANTGSSVYLIALIATSSITLAVYFGLSRRLRSYNTATLK